jgi:hypothetical protein
MEDEVKILARTFWILVLVGSYMVVYRVGHLQGFKEAYEILTGK